MQRRARNLLEKLLGKNVEVGILFIRITLGVVFIAHGYQKLFMTGPGSIAGFFGSIGIPLPALFAWVVSLVEFFGGICVILGVLTRYVAVLLAIIMIVAIFAAKLQLGLIAPPGRGTGYELDLVLLGGALMLLIAGPGRLSLERVLLGREV